MRPDSLCPIVDGYGCCLHASLPWRTRWSCGTDSLRATRPLTWHLGCVLLCSSEFVINVSGIFQSTSANVEILAVIPSDYSAQLTCLLRYPPLTSSSSTSIHPATLLLRQALTLQMSPSAATGVSIVHENLNLLDISLEVPEPPPPPMRRGRPRVSERGQPMSPITGSKNPADGVHRMHLRQGSNPMAIPEMLARGLLEKGESLGINKTVMNAVSELKVGDSIQDYRCNADTAVAKSTRSCKFSAAASHIAPCDEWFVSSP